jgi:hypothetical protein
MMHALLPLGCNAPRPCGGSGCDPSGFFHWETHAAQLSIEDSSIVTVG